jgi:EmrB/QacA subfamily drug resistance transporter
MQPDAHTEGPAISLSSPRGRWVVGVTVLGSAVAMLEATVVNVALPAIGRDLGAGVAGLQWTLNGYLLTLAALILLGGSLGDRYGRRRVFELGIAWFTAASLLCALAPNVEVLVAARVLQGIGGALLTPGSLAIIEAVIRPQDRARAIGAWSALGGVAAAVGPLLGGYLIDALSWRAIFFINVPLAVFGIWASRRHVPETRDPMAGDTLDLRGSLLAALGLAGITFALIQANQDPRVALAVGVVGVVALVAFVAVEKRSADPMLPLDIFASRQFTSANLVTFVVYAALGGVFFLLVVFLQVALGYSPIAAGAASLPITVLLLLLSARAGALAQRIGPRIPLTVGPLLLAAGMLLMRRINIGDRYVETVLPAVVVFGVGLAGVVAPVTATVLAAADPRHAGVASGVNNAVARTAQLVAVAALPLVVGLSGDAYQNPQAMVSAFHGAMLVTAALAAAGGLLAWATIRSDVLERAHEPDRAACQEALDLVPERHCAVAGPPLVLEPTGGDGASARTEPAPAAAR